LWPFKHPARRLSQNTLLLLQGGVCNKQVSPSQTQSVQVGVTAVRQAHPSHPQKCSATATFNSAENCSCIESQQTHSTHAVLVCMTVECGCQPRKAAGLVCNPSSQSTCKPAVPGTPLLQSRHRKSCLTKYSEWSPCTSPANSTMQHPDRYVTHMVTGTHRQHPRGQNMVQLLGGSAFLFTSSACHVMTAACALLGVLAKLLCYQHNSTNPAERQTVTVNASAYNISMRPSSTAETRE
jgi:hypothetical protein